MREFPIDPELKALWRDGLDYEVRRSSIAFFILIVLVCLLNLLVPSLREQAMDQIYSMMAGKDLLTQEGELSFLALFSNNMTACIAVMLYGLLPFVHLSALALGLNAALLGVMAAVCIAEGTPLQFLAAIIPHGIFEFPALILAFAMGLFVCGQLTRRCKKDQGAYSFLHCLTMISKLLFLVLVPLLVIAAAVEAWVTPMVLLLFQ